MYGKVLIFTFPPKTNQRMFIKTIMYGQHYGEYFGAALTSCDVNNDHRQELIVGAPQWSRDMDEGRVYIFTARHNVCYLCMLQARIILNLDSTLYQHRFKLSMLDLILHYYKIFMKKFTKDYV